ncbi:unnamed protein product, partial [Coccothraustes coccothraustes]
IASAPKLEVSALPPGQGSNTLTRFTLGRGGMEEMKTDTSSSRGCATMHNAS